MKLTETKVTDELIASVTVSGGHVFVTVPGGKGLTPKHARKFAKAIRKASYQAEPIDQPLSNFDNDPF